MKKLITLFAAALMATTVTATPLTPEQALAAARRSSAASAMMKAPAAPMKLVKTIDGKAAPTLYVFTPQNDTRGFLLLAADDAVPVILGYSDESTFDPDNIPDNVAYWLGQYSLYIEQQAGAEVRQRAATFDEHPAVSPLCSTTWNQGAPYNNLCPVISGERSVTGCVATALAQILKTYQWPDKGVGTYSYNIGSTKVSFDFGSTTFDWKNMLDNYPYENSGTTTQRKAVATLMSAVGVASEMGYSASGSGTNANKAALGLNNYLKYDRSLEVLQRDWYTARDWDNLVYSEIAAGYPVYYDGNDGSVGHAFVADGYRSEQYYHINWGWGGYCDGYFLLSNLYPAGQGIGGGSGEEGFNYGQAIIYNLRPADAYSDSKPYFQAMAFINPIKTDKTSYTRGRGNAMYINASGSSGGFYNFSLTTLNDLYIGAELVGQNSVEHLYYGYVGDLELFYGISGIYLDIDDFPEGQWKLYPAFHCGETGEWKHIHAPVNNGSVEYFIVNVTSTDVTVTLPEDEEEVTEPSATLTGITPSVSVDDKVYIGHEYTFTFKLKAPTGYNSDVYGIIYRDGNLVTRTDAINVDFSLVTSTEVNATLTIPTSTSSGTLAEGTYYVALATLSGNSLTVIPNSTAIEISTEDANRKVATYLGYQPEKEYDQGLYPGHTYRFNFDVYSASTWSGYVTCSIFNSDGKFIDYSDPVNTILNKGFNSLELPFTLPDDLTPGDYILAFCTIEDNYITPKTNYGYVTVTTEPLVMTTELKGILPESEVGELVLHQNTTSLITYDILSNKPWSNDVVCRLMRQNKITQKYETKATSEAVTVNINPGSTVTDTWTLNIDDNIPTGTYYLGLYYKENSTYQPIGDLTKVELANPVSGIETINADRHAPIRYYDLRGVEIPQPGNGVYLRRIGNKVEKIINKP